MSAPFHLRFRFTSGRDTHLNAPLASTTTSSTESLNRSINSPTTFLLWNSRRVAGSFWIKLQIAEQAHVRSAYSPDLSYSAEQSVSTATVSLLPRDARELFTWWEQGHPFVNTGNICFSLLGSAWPSPLPAGRCASGTRIGLCLHACVFFFFCALPIVCGVRGM